MKRAVSCGIIQLIVITLSSGRELPDAVAGNLQQFNDNGAWSLHQDPRVVIDIEKNKIIIGSTACSLGVDGLARTGNVEAVRCDLETGAVDWFSLRDGNSNASRCDNRFAPSFFIRPNGWYTAMFSSANTAGSHFRDFPANFFWHIWTEEKLFDWPAAMGTKADIPLSGSVLIACASENKLYNFVRSADLTFHFMVSDIDDTVWRYGGRILNAGAHGGGRDVFCQYAGNGRDRIDIIVTQQGDANTPPGIFHGYIKNGALHTSSGSVIDQTVFDTLNAVSPEQLTKIFPDGSLFAHNAAGIAWSTCVRHYPGDTMVAVITAGIPPSAQTERDTGYRIVYCLSDSKKWGVSIAAKTGLKPSVVAEGNFGQTALDPYDKNTIYISSTVDPKNGSLLGVHEIFKGTTGDNGKTWNWMPVTSRSSRDNLSPVVPVWNQSRTALLWLRGTCVSAHHYDASIVGIIEREGEVLGKKRYIDANRWNCLNGCCFDSLDFTYNEENSGADNRWHQLSGFGNNGTVIVSSQEPVYEDAMLIKMVIEMKERGIYDFWANFWGKPGTASNWLISTGLNPTVQLFRQMACRTVDTSEYDSSMLANIGDSLFLYQAYAGRDTLDSGEVICVFIDDHVLSVQQYYGEEGDAYRTWFDGVSYARIETPAVISRNSRETRKLSSALELRYVSSGSMLKVTYSAVRNEKVTMDLFDLKGKVVKSYTFFARNAGTNTETFSTCRLNAGAYLCQLTMGNHRAAAVARVIR